MYVMLNQRLSPFKNQRISQTRTPNAMETKHKLRQVNKNKWEFEIDTVVKFMIIESEAKSAVWVETNVDFIVPSSLEVVFEQLIENDYNTLPRSC